MQDGKRLGPLIAVLALTAVKLLQLQELTRTHPEAAAEEHVAQRYIRALRAYIKLEGMLSTREFYRQVAHLGGFLGRSAEGDPGWQTLWWGAGSN